MLDLYIKQQLLHPTVESQSTIPLKTALLCTVIDGRQSFPSIHTIINARREQKKALGQSVGGKL